MSLSYTLRAVDAAQSCDGPFGFNDGTADYIVNGWTGGTTTIKNFWKSTDGGRNWVAQSDFAYPGHTLASCVVNNVAYIVGGDVFSPTNSGGFIKQSYKFESGAWTQIAADCGIGNRCLAQLVYLNGSFYLCGGQDSLSKSTAVIYDTIQRSDDGCANFTTILADTKTQGFRGGLSWGAFAAYKNLIWKVGGGIYDNQAVTREHETSIFTSRDGINWTYRGEFRGLGRHYHQLFVHNGKLYVIGGYNGCFGGNLAGIWSLEMLSSGKVVQTFEGLADLGDRHAQTCWSSPEGIMLFGGTSNSLGVTQECWLISDSQVASPTVSASGVYSSSQSVSLSCATAGAAIHYTTDGTLPDSSSPTYTAPLSVSDKTYIKAIGVKDLSQNSEVGKSLVRVTPLTLLDSVTGIWAACSSRPLLSSYASSLIRVKESTGSTQSDIGISGDDIDTAALATLVGSGNGYIGTLYDQSGSARNFVTAQDSFLAVSSGTNTAGFTNAVAWGNRSGLGANMSLTATLPAQWTIAFRFKLSVLDSATRVLFDAGGGGVVQLQYDGAHKRLIGLVYVSGNKQVYSDCDLLELEQWHHAALTYDGANVLKLYLDGALQDTNSTTGAVSLSTSPLAWPPAFSDATAFQGDLQDLVILDSVADLATIQQLDQV